VLAKKALRAVVATLLLVSSLLVVCVPSAAAVVVTQHCTGLCGHWHVQDTEYHAGVNCVYTSDVLTKITVKPPEMNGRHTIFSRVGWRFTIQSTPNGSVWTHEYTSTYQNAEASLLSRANLGHGFSRRGWGGPVSSPIIAYRAIVDMRWQQNGSTEGNLRVRYQWYVRQDEKTGAIGPVGAIC
jgi:hypothetical protein